MSIPSFHPSLHTRVEGDQSKGALIPQGYIQAANINSSTNIYMKLRSTNENFFHKKRVNFQYDKDNRGTWWLALSQTCLCSPPMSIGKMERFGWCRKIQEQGHRGPWESWGIQGNHWPCRQCWLQGTNGQIERNSDDGRKFPNGSNGVVLVAELELAALISGFQISNSTSKASSLVGSTKVSFV